MSVLDKETTHVHLSKYLRLYYYDLAYASAGGLLFPKNIIIPVVTASRLTWSIIYLYVWRKNIFDI